MIDPELIRPVEYRLVVEAVEAESKVGSILLADTTKETAQRATTIARVVSVSDNAFMDPDVHGPQDRPKPGDLVLIGKYTGQPVVRNPNDKDTNYKILNDKDVLAIVPPEAVAQFDPVAMTAAITAKREAVA